MRAFVLGAGLGTRLRPLTESRPKPLVPVFGKPLIGFAFDRLAAAGVTEFVVNTHHAPEAYGAVLGARDGRAVHGGCEVAFRHEPVLLDTGGGIKNVEDLLGAEDFWVHNGDIIEDMDLGRLVAAHRAGGHAATLGLRLAGGPLQVALDEATGRVVDIRGRLGRAGRLCLFTGVSVLSPAVFRYVRAGEAVSVVEALLDMMTAGEPVGGVLLDEGVWLDLGTIEAYREAHRLLASGWRLSYAADGWPAQVAPTARLGAGVELLGWNAVGDGAEVGAGARIENTIVWPGARVAPGIVLRDCIVRSFAATSATSALP